VIDEAWMLMRQPSAAEWLFRMAKEFRKRWAGLTFASQDVADVLGTELGLAVITNSATQILLRQAPQTIDEVARVFALTGGQRAFLLRADQGEGLLCGSTHQVAFRAHASPQEDRLVRTDPEFLASLTDSTDTARIVYLEEPPDPGTPASDTDSSRTRRGGHDFGNDGQTQQHRPGPAWERPIERQRRDPR
jgi:hypothetical protein